MNLAAADRRLRGIDANLRHEIVPDLALDRQRRVEIDVFAVRAQIVEFGLRDEAALHLRLGQRDPHRTPQLAPLVFGEQRAQLGPSVSPREWRCVRRSFMRRRLRRGGAVTLLAMSAVSSSIMARGSSIRPVTTASKPRTAAS